MIESRTLRLAPSLLAGIAAMMLAIVGCGSGGKQGDSAAATPPPPAGAHDSASAGAPAPPAAVSLELGEKVFRQRCVVCHGETGHGDGAAAAALNPHPRNFHDAAYMKSRTDDELLLTIHNGKGAMPAWKSVLSEAEMRSALLYVRGFASKP